MRIAIGDRVKLVGASAPFGVVKFVRIHELIVSVDGGTDVALPAAAVEGAANHLVTIRPDRLPPEMAAILGGGPR